MSSELTTRELVIVSMYQSGWSPVAIARKLCIGAGDVRTFLKSTKAVAHLLEQEECTDQLISTLYRDGAVALKDALTNGNAQTKLRAAELAFKVAGKLKPSDEQSKKTINVEKFLAIIGTKPVTAEELAEVESFADDGRFAAIEGEVVDEEDMENG